MLRSGFVVAVCAAVSAIGASSAAAVPSGAVGRCPDGLGDPQPVSNIYDHGKNFYGLQSADVNGDGFTCIRILQNSPTKIAFSDNALPL